VSADPPARELAGRPAVQPPPPRTSKTVSERVSAACPAASTPPAGGVSGLDRFTLRLGVAVGMVIALCSYAVSATSLYALGHQAGYSAWQALAVPVVADGPAVYGMVRIVSRSRRGAKGAGYGWLLVIAGTVVSVAGNVAHAQPGWVARGIAAAIPLAVLAMLEGLKGDAREVVRLAAPAPSGPDPRPDPPVQPDTLDPSGDQAPDPTTTVRRVDPPDTLDGPAAGVDARGVRELPARTPRPDRPSDGPVRVRLAAVHAQGRPDGGAWSARTLAQAAGCARSTAAAFLAAHRQQHGDGEGSR
jgi:Protein of unknown function (DUF2637)